MKTKRSVNLYTAQLLIAFIFFCYQSLAQSPILGITTTYSSITSNVHSYSNTPATNSASFLPCVSTTYNYSFNEGTNNALKLLNITANGQNYFIVESAPATLKLRRKNNATVSGNRNIIFMESTGLTQNCHPSLAFTFKLPYQDDMEDFLNNNYINQGTDNIFTNQNNSDGNNNNIERVDVIFPAGISVGGTTDGGFALFDRGNNYAHDGFRIAAITSLDANGDPASFGPVKNCIRGDGSNNGSWGHPTTENGNTSLAVYVLRREESETQLKTSAAINQQLGGVFFTFADLEIEENQTFFGYCLLGPDGVANPTSAQILNLDDATVYPLNTTESIGGGLDLIAINALFSNGAPTLNNYIKNFKAKATNGIATINWELSRALKNAHLQLERSNNAKDFYAIVSQATENLPIKSQHLERQDMREAFYRLKIKTADGKVLFSNVIKASTEKTAKVKLYPNFIKSSQPVYVEGLNEDVYRVSMINSAGCRKYEFNLHVKNGLGIIDHSDKILEKGFYFLLFENKNQQVYQSSMLIVY